MPSGYTHEVSTGEVADFPTFAARCARALGPLVHMRDEPRDVPLPEPSLPDTSYYDEQIAEAQQRLADLDAMGDEEYADELEDTYREALRRHEERMAERREIRARYQAMISKVLAWTPPTPEHASLKAFMLDQLNSSIGWDCQEYAGPQPKDPATEKAAEREACERSIQRNTAKRTEMIEQHDRSEAWIEALKESLNDYQE
jgi:hypothetical protein